MSQTKSQTVNTDGGPDGRAAVLVFAGSKLRIGAIGLVKLRECLEQRHDVIAHTFRKNPASPSPRKAEGAAGA